MTEEKKNAPDIIEAVVFDVGWVLLRLNYKALLAYLREHGVSQSTLTEVIAAIQLDAHETGLLDGEGLLRNIASLATRTQMDVRDIERHWVEMFEPIPEMFALAANLMTRYRVFLLSNVGDLHWRHVVARYDLLSHCHDALPSFEAKVMKPNIGIYQEAERRFALYGPQTVFIDDLEPNVQGASKAGWHAILHKDPTSTIAQLQALGVDCTIGVRSA
jgi:FMN phosphatase YigB (HAD superfamily)